MYGIPGHITPEGKICDQQGQLAFSGFARIDLPPPGLVWLLRFVTAEKQKTKHADKGDSIQLMLFAVVQRMQHHDEQRGND